MAAKNLRNRTVSIVVSLALSFCLWMAISGQNMSFVDITVPLELAGLPENLIIKSEMPATVTFQVRANAAQIRFLTDRKPQLRLNVSAAQEGDNIFSIPTDSLDLPRGVQVGKSTPPVIEFETARVTSRIVPIRPVIRGHPDPAYNLASVVIEPDVATVYGPQELTEALEFLATVPIDVNGLTSDANMVVLPALVDLDPALTVTPPELRVYIRLEERLAEKTFSKLPITLPPNGPAAPAATIEIIPKTATVSVTWPILSRLGLEGSALDVLVRPNLKLLETGGETELPVLVNAPAGVKVTAIDPVNVKIKVTIPEPVPQQ